MARPKSTIPKVSRTVHYDEYPFEEWLKKRAIDRQKNATDLVRGGIGQEIVNIMKEAYERENAARI